MQKQIKIKNEKENKIITLEALVDEQKKELERVRVEKSELEIKYKKKNEDHIKKIQDLI